MNFNPLPREREPYPSHATQFRKYHGKAAWLCNPWIGKARDPHDIGTDVEGLLIPNP